MRYFFKFSVGALALAFLLIVTAGLSPAVADEFNVGTWKTAQTIQPFFYQKFMPGNNSVTVYPFTNPADQKTALLAGSLNMCGTTLAHAIHSASMGQPVVVVAALCNRCSALVVKKDAGIETVADLKGKSIGYVPGTMHEILLRETLARNGLSPQTDVSLIRVDFFDMGLALASGSIAGFLSGEPFPSLAVAKGYGKILSYPYYGKSIGAINAGMLVTQDFCNKHTEEVYALVMAHARASRFLTDHPEQWLARASEFGMDPAVLEKAAANMELAWDMDEAFVRRASTLGKRMEALGIIQRQPDYDRLIDLRFVKRVRNELNQHE